MKLVQFIEPGDGMRLGLVAGDEVLDSNGCRTGAAHRASTLLRRRWRRDRAGGCRSEPAKTGCAPLVARRAVGQPQYPRSAPHQAGQRPARPSPRPARVAGWRDPPRSVPNCAESRPSRPPARRSMCTTRNTAKCPVAADPSCSPRATRTPSSGTASPSPGPATPSA